MEVDDYDEAYIMEVDDHSYSWESCPEEILIIIFQFLNAKDLLSSMSVSRLWRAVANFVGNKSGRWLELVENCIQNKGSSFRQRTKLNYKELHLNSRMWYSVHKAQVKLKCVYNVKKVRNLHVYKDNLIVVCKDSVKFFNIETGNIIKEIHEPHFDYQETDYLLVKCTIREGKKHIFLSSKEVDTTYEFLEYGLCNVQHNKCHITNWKHAIEFFESTPTEFKWLKLGRFYSSPRLLGALHVYDNDMYVYITRGDVYFRNNGELGIKRVCTLDVPSPPVKFETPKETFITMFHKCSVIYGVDSQEKEKIVKNLDVNGEEHLVLLYYNLTCAIQHDDILLLGFKDGKVGVVLIKKLWTTYDLTPAFQFYIQEVAQVQNVEAVKGLEVYEADGYHHVFVTTTNNLYQVVISHADYKKVMSYY